jgi:hypothetical protein
MYGWSEDFMRSPHYRSAAASTVSRAAGAAPAARAMRFRKEQLTDFSSKSSAYQALDEQETGEKPGCFLV